MLKQRVQDDMKAALKGGDKRRLGIVRLILAAIKQREIDGRCELGDEEILAVLDKMVKQRRDSITQFAQAGRKDLVDQEKYELEICQTYLPAALSDGEITQLIDATIASTGATSVRDMGKVMGQIKPKVQGRADMGEVSALVKQKLTG